MIFLCVEFFDPHEPWDPPDYYVEMYDLGYGGEEVIYPAYGPIDYLSSDELTHCRAMYAGEATLVDKWIETVIEQLQDLRLCDSTTLIFTSNHAICFSEHDLLGKSIIMGDAHGAAPFTKRLHHSPVEQVTWYHRQEGTPSRRANATPASPQLCWTRRDRDIGHQGHLCCP
ncbi:MAG: sulfatase-like hydrolase/transferase [Thermoprotei archaeon]